MSENSAAVPQRKALKPVMKKKETWKYIRKYKVVYLLMLPALTCFLVFNYVPMTGLIMAFNNYQIGRGYSAIFRAPWVGFKNFHDLFSSFYFGRVLFNTVWINLLKFFWGFPAPILLAILMNEIKSSKYKRTIQTITYLPNFLSTVVVYGLILSMLSPTYGLVNGLFSAMGLNTVFFLASPQMFRSILVFTDIWRYTGFSAIIYLAAITSVDSELFEAAVIDGASKFRRIIHILLPCISEVILLMFLLQIGYIMSGDFETTFLMYSPPVYAVGDIIETYVYRQGLINFQFSFSTAVGLFKSLVGLVLVLGVNQIAKKYNKTGIW